MKIPSGIAAFLLVVAINCSADVVIWKQTINATKSGNGFLLRSTVTGFAVLDAQTGDITIINVWKTRGRFQVEPQPNAILNYVTLPGLNREIMVVANPGRGIGTATAKGNARNVDIGNGLTYWIASFLTVRGTDLYTDTDNQNYFEEFTGSFSFDSVDTKAANSQNLSFNDTIAAVVNYLTDLGYVEE